PTMQTQPQPTADVGVIGMAVMGRNLAKNIESRGNTVAIYNRTWAVTEQVMQWEHAKGARFVPCKELKDFVAAIKRPRRIIIMVQAGKGTDAVIESVAPLLQEGDILVDGGNAHWADTDRRDAFAKGKKFHFVGMGVSGGEEGARLGPAIMPGGDRGAVDQLMPVLRSIAAKAGPKNDEPCVTWCGEGSAGHFVKMVHNGIEYGDMQMIAECYDLMHRGLGMDHAKCAATFTKWNQGELASFLIELTGRISDKQDPEKPGKFLLDAIRDAAGQKGTGKWTTMAALEAGVPIPTITAAVDARLLSAMKDEREAAAAALKPERRALSGIAVDDLAQALYGAKISAYAQGMKMLAVCSQQRSYRTDIGAIPAIWRGGCIIRAVFLDRITAAYRKQPDLANLLGAAEFRSDVARTLPVLRKVVAAAAGAGIPVPALSASLAYIEGYTTARLPAYVIQAQRDAFGSHTYERNEKPGTFIHTEWLA
ncbi:MAG TPA: NADP-dependent phosphogluconate dehydrogenase, partial [Kofleriaceae bacterium]|nr:NADP-dependent phosphogluconate dehydrogenase [Kofleriaceae bacterium]